MKRRRPPVACLAMALLCVACGSGDGTGVRAVVNDQNQTAAKAATLATELLVEFDEFHAQQLKIETYDEKTGQAWVDYYEKTLIPGFKDLQDELQELAEKEVALETLVRTSKSSGATQRKATTAVIFIAGGIVLLAATATMVGLWMRTQAQVERAQDAVQQSVDNGLSPAQAWNENRSTLKEAQNGISLDIIKTTATQAVLSAASAGATVCGKIYVSLVDLAQGVLADSDIQLFGAKTDPSNGTEKHIRKGSEPSPEFFYLGQSSDGNFGNFPLGEYDLLVFKDGYVRGNVTDVSIESCDVTQTVPVTMVTPDDFFTDDEPAADGGGGGPLIGSCDDFDSVPRVCFNFFGDVSERPTERGFCEELGDRWRDDGCPSGGVLGACERDSVDVVWYAIPNDPNPEGTLASLRDGCVGVWNGNYVRP